MDKPKLKLSGRNGNAFVILGAARKAAREAGWTKEDIDDFMAEAMVGNYDHLLQTCMNHFEVE